MLKIIYTSLLAILFCMACQPLNRAAVKDRKAQVADSRDKSMRAVNLLIDAGRLNPSNKPDYYTQAAGLLFEEGKFKAAFRLLDKIPPCEGGIDCSPMEKAETNAWRGTLALQLGQRCEARHINYSAWRLMELYQLDNDSLRSVIRNNQAVSYIFCQSANSSGDEKIVNFKKVHRRDFNVASEFLEEATRYDPDNCTAAYNKLLLDAILSVPEEQWEYGYLPDTLYPQLGLPYYDCLPPIKKEEDVEFNFSTLTTELAKAKEIVLVLDISGSMSAAVVPDKNTNQPISRVQLMKAACDSLLSSLDAEHTQVGAITIGGSCGRTPLIEETVGSLKLNELNAMIQQLPLNGSTPLDERVLAGIDLFSRKKKSERVMFLFSDGVGGCTSSYSRNICGLATELEAHGIQFNVFSLLLESKASRQYGLLNCIVDGTDGMLLGVDEKGQTQDKTIEIKRMAASIPLFMDEIVAGESEPYLGEEDLRSKVDSLGVK